MNIGPRLLAARRRAGLSQRELADRTGVPQSTIARIESGVVDPRIGTVAKLLDACGESIEVTRRLGDGVDRSLIRTMLDLTPKQRLEHAATASRSIAALVKAAARDR
jgi:predicted transcriptional regulator